VELAAVEVEGGDHRRHGLGHQRGPVGQEQSGQGPSHPVVVEQFALGLAESDQICIVGPRPLLYGIERLLAQAEQPQHHPEHRPRRQAGPVLVIVKPTAQALIQAKTGEKVVDDRQLPQQLGL